MAAGIIYKLEARSVKYNDVYRVDILQEDYTGAITYKNIGAGHLRLSKSSGVIQKTTLSISIQADTDFEYTGFFQYNNFKHPVKLYKNGTQIWSGYLVAESYSEEYKNPPYDVELVATDGLGFLENYTFSNSGTQNYLAAIKHCLDNLSLVLDYDIAVDLYATGMVTTSSMFDQLYFNGDIFEGEKCSDVIERLLPFGAVLTQINNRWLIWRPLEDAEKTRHHYLNLGVGLAYVGTVSGETVLTMGDVATGGIYPIGTPLLEMEHAWKDAIITKNYGKRESFLLNHDFSLGETYWTDASNDSLVIVNGGNENYARLAGYCAIGDDLYIEQAIDVEATTDNFVFEVEYDALANTRYTTLAGFSGIQVTVRVQVKLGLYYLSTTGWTTTPTIMEMPIESSVSSPNWKILKIITDTIPATGTLIFKGYRIEHETFPARSNSSITGAVFTRVKVYTESLEAYPDPQSYSVDLLTNAAEAGNTIEVKPVTLPAIENASLMFANGNYLSGDVLTTTWVNNSETAAAIEQVIANQLKRYYGTVRHKISACNWRGSGLHVNAIAQHSKNSNRKFLVTDGEWYIIEDEYNLNWIEISGSGTGTPTEITGTSSGAVHENSTGSNNGFVTATLLPNGLISGGVVAWVSGLTFSVSAASYAINNTLYESAANTVTLATADATNPRIDVIAVDVNGEVVVITGTPAATPQKPQVDFLTQLELTFITVPATATAPTGITTEVVYNENTEWTGSYTGPTVNFDNTADPYTGTKDTLVSGIGHGDTIKFTAGSAANVSDYETITCFVKLNATMLYQHSLVIGFELSGSLISSNVILPLQKADVTNYQNLALKLSDFTFTATTFDAIRFTWMKIGTQTDHAGFYLDYIRLQKGITQPQPLSTHPAVTIAADSTPYLAVTEQQEISLDVAALNIPPSGIYKDWIEFEFRDIETGTAQEYILDLRTTVPYDIDSVVLQSDNTMDDVCVKIDGTHVNFTGPVTGMDVTTGITTFSSYSAYSATTGVSVVMFTSGTDGGATLLRGKLNLTRT